MRSRRSTRLVSYHQIMLLPWTILSLQIFPLLKDIMHLYKLTVHSQKDTYKTLRYYETGDESLFG